MKNLKDILLESLMLNEAIKESDFAEDTWEKEDLVAFLKEILEDENDIDILAASYKDEVKEYSLCIDDSNYEGLVDRDIFKDLDVDYDAIKKLKINEDFGNDIYFYWYAGGNGLQTIIVDSFDRGVCRLNVIGNQELYRIVDALPSGLKVIDNPKFIKDTYLENK